MRKYLEGGNLSNKKDQPETNSTGDPVADSLRVHARAVVQRIEKSGGFLGGFKPPAQIVRVKPNEFDSDAPSKVDGADSKQH